MISFSEKKANNTLWKVAIVVLGFIIRITLFYVKLDAVLGNRVETVTPVTSFKRGIK